MNLEPLEEVRKRLAVLRNPVIEPGQPGHGDFKLKVEAFYRWLNEVRQPLLNELQRIHQKKQAVAGSSKITNGVPVVSQGKLTT